MIVGWMRPANLSSASREPKYSTRIHQAAGQGCGFAKTFLKSCAC